MSKAKAMMLFRPWQPLLAATLGLWSFGYLPAEQPAERRYGAGPLAADDFRAGVPDPLPRIGRTTQLGFADTDIRFRLEYRYATEPEGVEAKLVAIDIYATFATDKSWLARQSAGALDHEQGHFDITQVFARQAQLAMKKQLADGKTLVGRGEDVAAALADLQNKVAEHLKPVYDRTAVAQKEYDQQTHNGVHAANQAAHRKRQIEVLKELNAELNTDADSEE